MSRGSTFILHPSTQELYTLLEAAATINITVGTLHGRLLRGDVGWQIWRPVGTKAKDVDPGKLNMDFKLIPYTPYDKLYR